MIAGLVSMYHIDPSTIEGIIGRTFPENEHGALISNYHHAKLKQACSIYHVFCHEQAHF